MSTNILSPVGRLVQGSIYVGQTKDNKGNPLVNKKPGPDFGKPLTKWFFAVAVPKTSCPDWKQTAIGQAIVKEATQGFPNGETNRRDFAWKVTDGDSPEVNQNNRAWNTLPGFPGCWVFKFSSGFAPKIYRLGPDQKPQLWGEQNAIQLGDCIEVAGTVAPNGDTGKPGVYLNHSMVCFRGYHPEGRFTVGPNPDEVGFGQSAAPAGVSTVPVGNAMPAPAAPAPAPAYVAPPVPAPAPAPSIPVAPNAAFMAPPPPARVMLPAAQGATYEQLIANGWTDALLIQHGMMAA